VCKRITFQVKAMENTRVNTEIGPTNSMVSIEVQRRWEGDLYGRWTRGRKAPLGRA